MRKDRVWMKFKKEDFNQLMGVLSKQMERYSEIEAQNLNLKADIKDEKECLLDLQNKIWRYSHFEKESELITMDMFPSEVKNLFWTFLLNSFHEHDYTNESYFDEYSKKHEKCIYKGNKLSKGAIQECTKGYKLNDFKENRFVGRFMKADVLIGLGLAGEGIVIKMKTPLRTINVDSVNPVGRVNFNRMYKRINDIRYSLNKTIETIQNYEGNLKIAKEMVNKPFELQDELTSARNRQKEINKILDTSGNENSKVVVEDDLEEERNESCMEL